MFQQKMDALKKAVGNKFDPKQVVIRHFDSGTFALDLMTPRQLAGASQFGWELCAVPEEPKEAKPSVKPDAAMLEKVSAEVSPKQVEDAKEEEKEEEVQVEEKPQPKKTATRKGRPKKSK